MKKFLLLASLALAAVSTNTAFAQASTAAEDELAALGDHQHVSRGMNPEAVQLMLGQPNARIGDNVWVYLNFQAKNAKAADKFDALLIVFKGDKVDTVRLTESQPVKAYLASLERKNSRVNIAKK